MRVELKVETLEDVCLWDGWKEHPVKKIEKGRRIDATKEDADLETSDRRNCFDITKEFPCV